MRLLALQGPRNAKSLSGASSACLCGANDGPVGRVGDVPPFLVPARRGS